MEQPWIKKAKETYEFHRSKLISNPKWTKTRTAQSLRRSVGGICEDIMIANWCKTHEKQLQKFDYARDALAWIRDMKAKQEVAGLD